MFCAFLILIVLLQILGAITSGLVPPCQLVFSAQRVACHGDNVACRCYSGSSDHTDGRNEDDASNESNKKEIFHGKK